MTIGEPLPKVFCGYISSWQTSYMLRRPANMLLDECAECCMAMARLCPISFFLSRQYPCTTSRCSNPAIQMQCSPQQKTQPWPKGNKCAPSLPDEHNPLSHPPLQPRISPPISPPFYPPSCPLQVSHRGTNSLCRRGKTFGLEDAYAGRSDPPGVLWEACQ